MDDKLKQAAQAIGRRFTESQTLPGMYSLNHTGLAPTVFVVIGSDEAFARLRTVYTGDTLPLVKVDKLLYSSLRSIKNKLAESSHPKGSWCWVHAETASGDSPWAYEAENIVYVRLSSDDELTIAWTKCRFAYPHLIRVSSPEHFWASVDEIRRTLMETTQ